MGTLTKYNALVGELEPYTPSRLALQKALADVKIRVQCRYRPTHDSHSRYKGAKADDCAYQ